MNEFFTEVYGSMSKDILGLVVIGLAIYVAYSKGLLNQVISFFKKNVPINNGVYERANAYQILHTHIKTVGTKTNLTALEALSGLILKESDNG